MVRTASGWVAQRDAPDLVIREQSDGTWVVFDGQGRTYLFTVVDPALAGAGLWHLASVTGPGGNKVALNYTVGHPSVPGAPDAVSIDLNTIQYNPDLNGCYKNTLTLGYDPGVFRMSDPTTLHQVPFPEIVVTSVETTGTQGLGGALSATQYAYGTLNALTTTDPNGTQHGTTFDGFGRPVLSTMTPPGGSVGALAATSFVGFAIGEPPGHSITQKVFTDPVDPAAVSTAPGRTGTVYLDELGRAMRTELALGADYGAG